MRSATPIDANIVIGKAGRKRHMNVRPTVRGTVMNPVDHPHGGGEGKNHTSGRPSVTPWGKPTKGLRTRKKKKVSNQHIIVAVRSNFGYRVLGERLMSRSLKKGPFVGDSPSLAYHRDERGWQEAS